MSHGHDLSQPSQALIPLYSAAVRVGRTLYVAGQLGIGPASGKLVDGGIEAQTRQTLDNLERILAENGYSRTDIVKTTCYLHDLSDYPAFNSVYGQVFWQPYPARATLGGLDLVLGALVEIECIAVRRSESDS